MINNYDALEDVVRDAYAGVVWTHKVQEKQADIYSQKLRIMRAINMLAISITSAGVLAIIFADPQWLKIASVVTSFIGILTTSYLRLYDLQNLVALHKASANRLVSVRDQFKMLLTKTKLQSDSVENLLLEYGELIRKRDEVYLDAPITSNWAVRRAGKALKINKDNTYSEEEIDLFLPGSLRRKANEQ